MANKQPTASAPKSPPPPKRTVGSIGHVAASEMGKMAAALTAFAANPVAMKLWRELEQTRIQAQALGVMVEFDICWDYEVARHMELLSAAPEPKQVLQIVLKTFPKVSGD